MEKNKTKNVLKEIGRWLFLIVIFMLVWSFLQKLDQSYQDEQDYVCFSNDCSYLQAKYYNVNSEGTCLTRTDSGNSIQRCGGNISITRPYANFSDRLKAVFGIEQSASQNPACEAWFLQMLNGTGTNPNEPDPCGSLVTSSTWTSPSGRTYQL